MQVNPFLKFGLVSFIVYFGFTFLTSAADSSIYPLQSKYPEIMLYKANTKQKVIALTFDDGPDRRFTPEILDVLQKHHVKATFFLLGIRIQKYPEIAKRINDEGHVIGNHTYWHPQLTKMSAKTMALEIEKNEEAIRSVTSIEPHLFRAPYGLLNDDLVVQLGKMGYRGVGWSIDTEDWKSLPSDKIKQNILDSVHPGAIILMHSAGHWTQDLSGTAKALDEIIPYLKKQGYEFVTVPELWS